MFPVYLTTLSEVNEILNNSYLHLYLNCVVYLHPPINQSTRTAGHETCVLNTLVLKQPLPIQRS